ncbi:unnamed protein product [Boreogadus saida]
MWRHLLVTHARAPGNAAVTRAGWSLIIPGLGLDLTGRLADIGPYSLFTVMNELPADVRTAESLPSFRQSLKTRLFRGQLKSA